MSNFGLDAGGYNDTTITTNTDLVPLIKAQEVALGLSRNVTFIRDISFIPTAQCTININGGSDIIVKSDIGYSNGGCAIRSFVVQETAIEFIMAFNY